MSNKNIRTYLDKTGINEENKGLLGRIQSARSVYSVQKWKEDEDRNTQYKKNLQQKYFTNNLAAGAKFCPLDAYKKAENASVKRLMYYQVDDDFDKRFNISNINTKHNYSINTNSSKISKGYKQKGRAKSA